MMLAPPIVFLNARLTNDPSGTPYAVLIESGHVAKMQPMDGFTAFDTENEQEQYNLAGDYLAPSMVDHHVHFSMWSKMRSRISFSGVSSLSEALILLNTSAAERDPATQPALVGQGLMLGSWPDEDVTKMTSLTLDNGVPDTGIPVIIYMNDLHSFWANSSAIRWLNVPSSMDGYRTGLFREAECFQMMVVHNVKEAHYLDALLFEASKDAARKGVTEIVDLEWDFNMRNWSKRVKDGMTYLRVRCGMYPEHIHQAIADGHRSDDVIEGTDGLISVGPFKIISDGSLGTRTACCHRAYPSPPAPPNDHGLLSYTPEQFKEFFELAQKHSFRLAVHTIGDKTASVVLDQLETLSQPPLAGSTIEHAQLMFTQDLPRMAALGLAASVQPQHLNDDRELLPRFWPGLTDRAFAYASIAQHGIELRLGSDAPVAPLDPWMAMAAGISRLRRGETGPGYHDEQRLSREVAYAASTSGRRLQVAMGDIADLVVLPFDPLTASVEQLWAMEPEATLLGGRFTYNAWKTEPPNAKDGL